MGWDVLLVDGGDALHGGGWLFFLGVCVLVGGLVFLCETLRKSPSCDKDGVRFFGGKAEGAFFDFFFGSKSM